MCDNGGMIDEQLQPELPSDINRLLQRCIALIADSVDYDNYVKRLAESFTPPSDAAETDALQWPVALAVGRAIWRQTPNPAHDYSLPPLPETERNAPCHCGSGRKYKQCCRKLDQDLPIKRVNFLPMLLEHLPRRRWSELAGSRIPPEMVLDATLQMNREHRQKDACALLEPWFVNDADFNAKREDLFDMLADVYSQLDLPRKKSRLLKRAVAVGDARLRSAALQRKATMASDRGNYTEAWKLFSEAQRSDPDSPSLSQLEVLLLLSEGRDEEARERARFWAHRMEARCDPELEELVGFMRQVSIEGDAGMARAMVDADPALNELAALLENAPPVASLYALKSDEQDSAGPLKLKAALAKALRAWHKQVSKIDHSPLAAVQGSAPDVNVEDWLPLLRSRPELWNAFEALDTIVSTLQVKYGEQLTETLLRSVLDRAERLLHEVLRANGAEGKRLEWGWLENRPALSLVGERITIDSDRPATAEHVARLEWLVCTLNPNDNQGFRDMLVREYLEMDRIDDALALTERYPDDFPTMRYNRVLALFAAGQHDAALRALKDASDDFP
jgi:tetratricopeptide (TPR) repeat protein